MRVGAAAVDYTPPPGLPLMGNYRQDYAARGVHDPLYARALVFEDAAGSKAALLSVDVCMLDRGNVEFIRNTVAAGCSIAPSRLLVAATHTHSAPAPMRLGSLPKAEDADIARFLAKAAGAVIQADANLGEATLRAGSVTEERVSFNRRLLCRDGKTHMNWEGLDPDFVLRPRGPADPHLAVLAVERNHAPVAAAVNFALHPAVLAGDNWLYSADWPGCLAASMAQLFGEGSMTAFFNGCAGNVNHVDYRDWLQGRGFQMTERLGSMVAVSAAQALRTAAPVEGDCVAVSSRRVALQRLRIGDEERRWCEGVLEASRRNPTPGQVDGLPDEYWAVTRLAMYEKQTAGDEVEVMAMRVGNLAIVGLPGEIFCEYGLEIRRRSPARHTFVIELANDAIGYVPTAEAFEEGGYEPSPGAAFYTPDAGGRLAEAALDQLNGLFGK